MSGHRLPIRPAIVAVIAASLTLVVAERAGSSAPVEPPGHTMVDWPTTDGVGGNHYSTLADITAENVNDLKVAWTYRTGDVSPPHWLEADARRVARGVE